MRTSRIPANALEQCDDKDKGKVGLRMLRTPASAKVQRRVSAEAAIQCRKPERPLPV